MDVLEAITGRASTRAFLDTPVSPATVSAVLDVARWAPSGVNTQPWHVAVIGDENRRRISRAIVQAREADTPPNPDYDYYPRQWREPYKTRRLRCGLALYGALDIARNDRAARKAAWYRNYSFFGAPVGLLFFIDRDLTTGSWLDMGMFLQSVMLAARSHGLATCPQASLAEYPDLVRGILQLPPSRALVCGIALGYADANAPVNRYRTEREPVEAFTQWFD
ncbi:MAG: nitroreductase [Gammaproteobacteria bacterium]